MSPVSTVFHNVLTVSIVLKSDIYLVVVQDWYRTVFRIEDPDPYPLTNGGQT